MILYDVRVKGITMEGIQLTERDYLIAIESLAEVMDALVGLASCYMADGYTQEAADVLAFVLIQPETAVDTCETAQLLFEDLESRICPRVILDAQSLAVSMTLDDVLEYVFAGEPDEDDTRSP